MNSIGKLLAQNWCAQLFSECGILMCCWWMWIVCMVVSLLVSMYLFVWFYAWMNRQKVSMCFNTYIHNFQWNRQDVPSGFQWVKCLDGPMVLYTCTGETNYHNFNWIFPHARTHNFSLKQTTNVANKITPSRFNHWKLFCDSQNTYKIRTNKSRCRFFHFFCMTWNVCVDR